MPALSRLSTIVRIKQATFKKHLARVNNRTDILTGYHGQLGNRATGTSPKAMCSQAAGNRSKTNEGPGLALSPRLQRVEAREELRREALVGQWGTYIAGSGRGSWDRPEYVPDVMADWARPLEADV